MQLGANKMVYATPDDCKSELGKKMQYMRAERPDEWTMDEFIRGVEEMEEKIRKLQTTLKNVHDKLEYGDVYQWDDGDNCWEEMRRLCL
jgi:hypothetical protein